MRELIESRSQQQEQFSAEKIFKCSLLIFKLKYTEELQTVDN